MKKLFALMLTLCLLLSCTAVLAEAAEDTMSGSYVDLDKIGMKIYIFDSMVEDPDAEPDENAELLYAWKDAEGADDYFKIEAVDLSEAGIATAEAFLSAIQATGKADSAELVTLENGLQVVLVSSAEEDEICASIVYDNGIVLGFTVGPIAGQEGEASTLLGYLMGTLLPLE